MAYVPPGVTRHKSSRHAYAVLCCFVAPVGVSTLRFVVLVDLVTENVGEGVDGKLYFQVRRSL